MAVETPRALAEERAGAEILALGEELEREHARAEESLAEVERRLERAEARVARASAPTTEPPEREPIAAGD
jgi:hypothetical protein